MTNVRSENVVPTAVGYVRYGVVPPKKRSSPRNFIGVPGVTSGSEMVTPVPVATLVQSAPWRFSITCLASDTAIVLCRLVVSACATAPNVLSRPRSTPMINVMAMICSIRLNPRSAGLLGVDWLARCGTPCVSASRGRTRPVIPLVGEPLSMHRRRGRLLPPRPGDRPMTARAIGLDVGTNAVRAVEIELGNPPLIRRMGQVGLPIGAVVDGEVADVGAVAIALRELWNQAGFTSRQVRVGMTSARMIVRTIEMPRLSHDELVSTIRLQLDDYVPLPPDETVFDIRAMDGPDTTHETVQLLLAATHQDAVQPLLMAMHAADLRVAAVDVIPAALALALSHPEPDRDDSVDVILSIGAGTVVMVAARDGEPLFSRTLTNACGRRTTERIASRLGIGELEAERYKRLGATEDATSAVALKASTESLDELIEEVRASLAFYAEQPDSKRVRRVLVTGGGSQLATLPPALGLALGLDVERADPFADVRLGHTGFEPGDLPYLAPYMAAAYGVALGQARPKDRRLDLTPTTRRSAHLMGTRRLLVGVGAVVLVGAAGAYYMQGRSQIAEARDQTAVASAQLADLQTQIAARVAAAEGTSTGSTATPPLSRRASRRPHRLGCGRAGGRRSRRSAGRCHHLDPGSSRPVDASTSTGVAPPLGTLSLTATAPGLPAVADWLDSLAADPKFAEPWAAGLAMVTQTDGSTAVQFSIEMLVTAENLVVARSVTAEVPT